jgi:hypothetical protein
MTDDLDTRRRSKRRVVTTVNLGRGVLTYLAKVRNECV